MEEDEKAPKLAPVRFERFTSEIASFRGKFTCLMEVPEEEARSPQKFRSERNRLMESPKEEAISSQVQS